MRPRALAFTLIELLVVVAIITALIAILLPSLARAREVTNAAVCATSLRSFGQAHYTYAIDNKNRFISMGDWEGRQNLWYGQTVSDAIQAAPFYKYTASVDLYLCPTFAAVCGRDDAVRSYVMNWNVGNYEANQTIAPAGPWRQSATLNLITDIRSESTLGLMTEENAWTHPTFASFGINDGRLVLKNPDWPQKDTMGTYHLPDAGLYADDGYAGGSGDRNSGKGNVLFVDGHVALHLTTDTPVIFNPQW